MVIRRIISGLVLILVTYLIVALVKDIWRLSHAGNSVVDAETRLKSLAREHYELNRQIAESTSSAYIEQQVRNNLYLTKPGETLVLLPDKFPTLILPEPTPTPLIKENWELWWEKFR